MYHECFWLPSACSDSAGLDGILPHVIFKLSFFTHEYFASESQN